MGALVKSIVAGVIGGAIGAAVWAVIAYQAHVEIGWIAWGIGVLVGIAVRLGAGNDVGPMTGGIAAIIAAASVAGGKYAAVSAFVDDAAVEFGAMVANASDDEIFLVLVDDIAVEFANQGKPMTWPEGMDYDSAMELEEYPKEVVAEARARWDRADEAWRDQFREYARGKMKQGSEQLAAALREEGFIASFGLLDVVFFLLAVASAYGIGSGTSGGGD
jgi:hypothetical protein